MTDAARPRELGAVFDLDVEWQRIAPAARVVWGVEASAVALVPIALVIVVGAVAGPIGLGAAVVASLAVLWLIWWMVGRRYRAWGYALREHDLVLRRGLLVRRLTIVPFERLQFIDIGQGPLDRMLRVASVQLHTAAAASDAKIPLLVMQEAQRVRDRLAALGESHDAGP
jgi:membrane protein YdbS with pleckstrin-like domain